jgi:hypothetical protein
MPTIAWSTTESLYALPLPDVAWHNIADVVTHHSYGNTRGGCKLHHSVHKSTLPRGWPNLLHFGAGLELFQTKVGRRGL